METTATSGKQHASGTTSLLARKHIISEAHAGEFNGASVEMITSSCVFHDFMVPTEDATEDAAATCTTAGPEGVLAVASSLSGSSGGKG